MIDVLVAGAGKSGLAAARAATKAGARVLLLERAPAAPPEAPAETLPGALAFDVVRAAGRVGGLLAVRGREVLPLESKAVVLACGGVAGLWQADAPDATGDALALAHRAGARLHRLHELRRDEGRVWLHGGVLADRSGRTSVPGLYACGAATGGEVGGLAAGDRAARDALAASPPVGAAWPAVPDIDEPLPETFADVKMDRLRRVMNAHLPPEGPRRADEAFRMLHALKGEADDFARARIDARLYAWRTACEAALLVATGCRDAARAGT